jgi:hypothetical protein
MEPAVELFNLNDPAPAPARLQPVAGDCNLFAVVPPKARPTS